MAKRLLDRLTARRVETEKRPGRYVDGKGLCLEVDPSGAKRWILRIMVQGRRRDMGLGGVVDVSLADARQKAAEARRIAKAGLDPIEARRKAQALQTLPSFRKAAEARHAELTPTWKNAKHAAQWLKTLEAFAFPSLGETQVDRVDGPAIRDVLLPIWLEKPETARRVAQRIGDVLEWARGKGYRSGDNPIRSIAKSLPRQPKRQGHFKALEYSNVPAFLSVLRECNSGPMAKLAFEFLILTAARTSEVINAEWREFDLEAKIWTIPAERMKAKRPHTIPLPARCIEILDAARQMNSAKCPYVFESRPKKPFSNMVFLKALEDMGFGDKTTAHGFRSAFRDWAAETTSFPSDVVEMALAHSIRDKTEAAYRRGDLLEKRRDLMAAWERHCHIAPGKVVYLQRA